MQNAVDSSDKLALAEFVINDRTIEEGDPQNRGNVNHNNIGVNPYNGHADDYLHSDKCAGT